MTELSRHGRRHRLTSALVATAFAMGANSCGSPEGEPAEPVTVDQGVFVYQNARLPHGDALLEGALARDDVCGFTVDGVPLVLPSTADMSADSFEVDRQTYVVGEQVRLGGGGHPLPLPPVLGDAACASDQYFKVAWEQSD